MCIEVELYEGSSITLTFVRYGLNADEVKVPQAFDGTFSCIIFSDPARKKPVLTFEEVDSAEIKGITKNDNQLIVFAPVEDNTLKQNEYFLGLFNTLSEEVSFPEVQVTVNVKASR